MFDLIVDIIIVIVVIVANLSVLFLGLTIINRVFSFLSESARLILNLVISIPALIALIYSGIDDIQIAFYQDKAFHIFISAVIGAFVCFAISGLFYRKG